MRVFRIKNTRDAESRPILHCYSRGVRCMSISLIGDLITQEQKQRAFAKDPEAPAAGLTDEERKALASRDLDALARLITKHLNRVIPTWATPRLRITPPIDPAEGRPGQ